MYMITCQGLLLQTRYLRQEATDGPYPFSIPFNPVLVITLLDMKIIPECIKE